MNLEERTSIENFHQTNNGVFDLGIQLQAVFSKVQRSPVSFLDFQLNPIGHLEVAPPSFMNLECDSHVMHYSRDNKIQ